MTYGEHKNNKNTLVGGSKMVDFFTLVIKYLEEHSQEPLEEINSDYTGAKTFWDEIEDVVAVKIQKNRVFEIEYTDKWGETHRIRGNWKEEVR